MQPASQVKVSLIQTLHFWSDTITGLQYSEIRHLPVRNHITMTLTFVKTCNRIMSCIFALGAPWGLTELDQAVQAVQQHAEESSSFDPTFA